MKRLIFLSCFLFLTFFGFSQTYTLSGTVKSHDKPLTGVNISVKNTAKGTVSDLDGNYQLKLPKGNYIVVFSYGNEKTINVELNKNQTLNVDLTNAQNALDEVFISSIRVDADSPVTHSNLSHKELEERNLGQDIPILMKYMPSVVTTSDAGSGVGYTGIRVRGSDATRVNVTINGVPLNDSESQATVFVDLGDFTSSIQNLQLQRGVGSSTNGAGAFGASLNILTDNHSEKASAEITNTYGSFNTHKHHIAFNTGLLDKHWTFSGQASLLKSDGYRDRSFSDLKSYFLQSTYHNKNTLIKALGFGGSEQTYQAYYGISPEKLKSNRRFNPAGMFTDSTGTAQFYDNQTDNYKQDNFQLLWNQKYNAHWSSNLTLHYTYGRGYYESFREDADLQDYGLPNFEADGEEVTTSDLVSQKWLSNHFYGTVFNLTYKEKKVKAILGGGLNKYLGDHYGDVIYARFAKNNNPLSHYYDNRGTKTDFNIYGKVTVAVTNKLSAFGDLQLRSVHYSTDGKLDEGQVFAVDDNFSFFNPKAGLTYQLNQKNQFYFSFARANREPSRDDYKSNSLDGNSEKSYPKAEKLNDFELGWRYKTPKFQMSSNVYYMGYQDQLVLTGDINDVGAFVRKNSGKSYRLGLEIDADITVTKNFSIRPNIALSRNKNQDFVSTVDGDLKKFGATDISFSPNIIAGNMLRYEPIPYLQLNFLTKFVGEQYLSNTEAKASKLDSYLVNGLNVQYTWKKSPLFKEVVFTGLVNNIFDEKYVSNGYYSPAYGPSYYPMAGINFLTGIKLKF